MIRLRRFLGILLLAYGCLHAQGQTSDYGISRAYREAFDHFLSEAQYASAEAEARAVLTRAETTHGRESVEAALALDLLIELYVYGDRVRDPVADEYASRAIAIKEKVLGPDHPHLAITLRLIGHLMEARADFTRARQFHERSVAIHRKTMGTEPRQESSALAALAGSLAKTGDFAQARSVQEEALAIRQKYFSPETFNTANQLVAYAILLREMGEFGNAETNFRRALGILERKAGRDHVSSAQGLNEYGALLTRTGRLKEAVPVLERALAIEERAYGPDHVDLVFVLSNLAAARAALDELPTARMLYERAIGIAVNVYGEDHPEVARILSGYAGVLLRMGDRIPAQKAALRTEEIGRAHLALTIRSLPEREALLFASRRPAALDTVLAVAAQDRSARRNALDAVIRSRALVFDEMAARRRALSGAHDPEMAQLSRALFTARERLSRLVMQGPRTFGPKQYVAALEAARRENDAAGRAVAERSAAFRSEIARSSAGLDDVVAILRPTDALVSFVRYGTPPVYAAFVQRGTRADPILIPLGPARTIQALVDALRKRVQEEAEAPGLSSKRSEVLYRAAGEALRRRIWDPLEPALAHAGRIFLTPDHALNLVDFGALPDRTNGYLEERRPVLHYLSTERDLIAAPPDRPGQGLLAMGSPAFDRIPRASTGNVLRGARPACEDFAAMRFDPLPASGEEVREIGALWRKSGKGDVMERTGEAANTAAFRANAPGRSVLHVAAHAFFAGEGCRTAQGSTVGENPLLLSGIALAGANRRLAATSTSEDGILTAEEIAALDLGSVEWAVLSGCATGDGKLLPGEGVFGLRRAFRIAGARTVIMSLWPVDDASTRAWMTTLYREHFAGSKSAAESVRAAGIAALAKRRAAGLSTHPFYWAGFIAAGDER
jgi:CHAT domain-containing protein/Tfp pilus assembly protein PilF